MIRNESRVKWNNPKKGVMPTPLLHVCVVAKEKGAFGLPLTTVANFTFMNKKRINEQ